MKKGLLFILLLIGTLSFGQDTKTEYLTIKVQYGLKTTGIINEVHVDIGNSGQHSLSGQVFNDDGVVTIDGREYTSEVDLLNYFGNLGWYIYETRTIQIVNKEYYSYLLIKKSK